MLRKQCAAKYLTKQQHISCFALSDGWHIKRQLLASWLSKLWIRSDKTESTIHLYLIFLSTLLYFVMFNKGLGYWFRIYAYADAKKKFRAEGRTDNTILSGRLASFNKFWQNYLASKHWLHPQYPTSIDSPIWVSFNFNIIPLAKNNINK